MQTWIAKIANALQNKLQKLQTAKFCKNQIMQNLQTTCKTDANDLQNRRELGELGERCELQSILFDGQDIYAAAWLAVRYPSYKPLPPLTRKFAWPATLPIHRHLIAVLGQQLHQLGMDKQLVLAD